MAAKETTPLQHFADGMCLLLELLDRDLIDPQGKADGREKAVSALHSICKAVAGDGS